MVRTLLRALVLLAALATAASADAFLVGRVTDLLGKPVANVRVHVLTPGDHQIVTTDDKGEYRVSVDGNKQIAVVVGAGNFHTFRGGTCSPSPAARPRWSADRSSVAATSSRRPQGPSCHRR